MVGKLFFTYSAVFELAQNRVFKNPKQVTWIAAIRHLTRKKHDHMSRQRICIILCVLSLPSVWGRFLQLYCDIGSLRRSNSTWVVNPLSLFSHIPNINAVNIYQGWGKFPVLAFYELFLRDESQDFGKLLTFLTGFFGCALCCSSIDTHSFQ